jgi:hypothetical protein
LGWGFIDSLWNVTFPWWKKIDWSAKGVLGINLESQYISQAYDINFWRANLVDWGSDLYDTWLVSEYIKNKYSCKGNINVDPIQCYSPIVVQYEK